MRPQPIRNADLRGARAVFTDVDGTLTTGNQLQSPTLAALEDLQRNGIRVVLVSGRPSGWGECWMRTLPVHGAIVENGALYYARNGRGEVAKVFAQPAAVRKKNRARLIRELQAVLRRVPGARLSTDSVQTEVDLAIDYNEQVKLGEKAAAAVEKLVRQRGITAVRSSVHVNCWIGKFDKLRAVRRFIRKQWRWGARAESTCIYVGDSFNDAPMFGAFALSVGVANLNEVIDRLDSAPAFITEGREGRGFEELVRQILVQRGARR
jgi:HAD superfamily hydrolase (TIGR01484 family)